MKRSTWWCGVVALLAVFAVAAGAQETAEAAKGKRAAASHWYALQFNGQHAGWLEATQKRSGEQWISETSMTFELGRAGATIRAEATTRFIETDAGELVHATSRMKIGDLVLANTLNWKADTIEVTSEQAGKTTRSTVARKDDDRWLSPRKAEALLADAIREGRDRVTYETVDPAMGARSLVVTLERMEGTTVQVLGKTLPGIRWKQSVRDMPAMSGELFTDEAGRMLASTMDLGGMKMRIVAADASIATMKLSPPDLLAATLLTSNKAFKAPRSLTWAVYELRVGEGKPKPPLPSAGIQRAVWTDERTVRVVVDQRTPVAARDDLPTRADREPSAMVQSDDAKVLSLVREAIGETKARDAERQAKDAEAMRQFVHRLIDRKDLSVGYASAADTARTKQGDCTEHAVLLAAMLRAADTPARTVSGLVYADAFAGRRHVFAYHMWTQAWLNPDGKGSRWVDLDATLESDTATDATHVTLDVRSDSVEMHDMMRVGSWIGAVELRVIESSED